MDWITLAEACRLLEVSRPTLNQYRHRYRLKEIRLGGRTRLSKSEIIAKIILPSNHTKELYSLSVFSEFSISQIEPFPGIYDLRRLKGIDAYGVLALLCSINARLKEFPESTVHLLLEDSPFCNYLEFIGFFTEVERAHKDRISCNYSVLSRRPVTRTAVILPLHLVGYRGGEKKILDEIYDPLLRQGFSEEYCSYIGWIIGELCDNAHSHSEGPCYLIIEALPTESTERRFLTIAVGDIGIGIPASLRKNPKYESLPERILFPMSFQAEISRMEVEPKRGKGLNDVVGISKGNRSWLRAESGDQALLFDFRPAGSTSPVRFAPSVVHASGTRFCFILVDNAFEKVERGTVDQIMSDFIRKEPPQT